MKSAIKNGLSTYDPDQSNYHIRHLQPNDSSILQPCRQNDAILASNRRGVQIQRDKVSVKSSFVGEIIRNAPLLHLLLKQNSDPLGGSGNSCPERGEAKEPRGKRQISMMPKSIGRADIVSARTPTWELSEHLRLSNKPSFLDDPARLHFHRVYGTVASHMP